MNRLNERELQLHVSILGWLFIAGHALLLLLAALGFVVLPTLGAVSGDRDALAVPRMLRTAFGVLMVVLALPGMLAGYGLLKRKPWARYLALVVGIIGLMDFPVGTVIGIYALLVLLQESATDYFAPGRSA
jgi:hypothetical protein